MQTASDNLFIGFQQFCEKKDLYVATVKKQFNVPKQLWLGMPIILDNVRLGQRQIRRPTVFFVTDFDDRTVTIRNSSIEPDQSGQPWKYDNDGELDVSGDNLYGQMEVILKRDDFYKLCTPQIDQSGEPML